MNNTALKTICDFYMLESGDRVIAAVSGGADSMALICFLLEIQKEFSLSLYVCHVNHMLRGNDADGDEQFVREFCKERSIPFYLHRCDVKSLAEKSGKGFEECGRDVRYAFFEETAKSIGRSTKIATAHTLSDSAETLVFNLARGSSPAGLCSIAPVRDNIIRPLIRCSRNQIEQYLKALGQDFRTDKSNSDIIYSRNFIRHRIVPLLKELNPAFETAVLNFTDLSREQQDFFEKTCEQEYLKTFCDGGLSRNELLKRNIAIARSIITKFLRENNVVVTKKRIDDILLLCKKDRFCISVCKNTALECTADGIIRFKENSKRKQASFEFPAVLGEHLLSDGRVLRLKTINYDEFKKIKENFPNLLKNCLNYDIIDSSFIFRARKSGDFITLFPRNVTKTLKKLFNESKIETDKRDIIPVLACGEHILWVEGLGVDRSAAVTNPSNRILFIEILETDKNGEQSQ